MHKFNTNLFQTFKSMNINNLNTRIQVFIAQILILPTLHGIKTSEIK